MKDINARNSRETLRVNSAQNSNGKIRIILDTDIGGDCDDTGALAIIDCAARAGLCELCGVAVSTRNPYAPACADAINRYYGLSVPVARTAVAPPLEDASFFPLCYGKTIAEKFDSDYYPRGEKTPEDAVAFYRKLLSETDGGKFTVVAIGSLTNVAALLDSGADVFSPLSGAELVSRRVEKFCVMGCFFPTEKIPEVWFGDYNMRAECNIKADIPAARAFFSRVAVPVYVSHYLLGLAVRTGARLMLKDKKNPVAEAYRVHSGGDRESWDPITALYSVYGESLSESGLFYTRRGRVSIDEEGVSTFVADDKSDVFVLECKDFEQIRRLTDCAMCGENL